MRLSDFNYTTLVLAAYRKKQADNKLSTLLAHPTRANIREECLLIYKERPNKKDDNLLRAVFGPAEPGKETIKAIEDFDLDKFRQLDKFLKGDTEKIFSKNLELLAWLIDFPHRPYVYGMKIILEENEIAAIESAENKTGTNELELLSTNNYSKEDIELVPVEGIEVIETANEATDSFSSKPSIKDGFMKGVHIFLITVLCLGCIYSVWQNKVSQQIVPFDIQPSIARCKAITQKGTQCKRPANSTGYCWQHDGN